MLQSIKKAILFLLTPLQKLLQRLSRPEPEMTRFQVDYLMEVIEQGDLLVCYEGGRLTSPFIRGIWDHLAVVTDKNRIMEAVAPEVRECDLEEWLFKKKGVAVLKYTGPKSICIKASQYVHKYAGWPYDYMFTYTNKKAYCSEIGFLSYREFDKEFMSHFTKRQILPQDFYDSAEKRLSNLTISRQVLN